MSTKSKLPNWLNRLNRFANKYMQPSSESAGEHILNKTIEKANAAKTDEERKQIYNDSAKKNLATTGASLATLSAPDLLWTIRTNAGRNIIKKAAVDMATSMAGGELVNKVGQKLTGQPTTGRFVMQQLAGDKGENLYDNNLIAQFGSDIISNPGYALGSWAFKGLGNKSIKLIDDLIHPDYSELGIVAKPFRNKNSVFPVIKSEPVVPRTSNINLREKLGIPKGYNGTVKDYFLETNIKLPEWAKPFEEEFIGKNKASKTALEHFNDIENSHSSIWSASNDELINRYAKAFNSVTGGYEQVPAFTQIRLPDGRIGYAEVPHYKFKHNISIRDFNSNNGDVIAAELNRRKLFLGIDLSDVSSLDQLSKISEALKTHPFIKSYRGAIQLPLDISHMTWYKKPALIKLPEGAIPLKDRGLWLARDVDELTGDAIVPINLKYVSSNGERFYPNVYSDLIQRLSSMPKGTSLTELNTSSASEGIKSVMAGLNYGTGRGQMTVRRIFPNRYYPDLEIDAILGNNTHFPSIEYKNGEFFIAGKKPKSFKMDELTLRKIAQGTASDSEIKTFDNIINAFKNSTIDHMSKGVNLLNRANPTLNLSMPKVVYETPRTDPGFKQLTQSDYIDMANAFLNNRKFWGSHFDPQEMPFKMHVWRDPIVIDLHKQGGVIKGQNGFLNMWQRAYNSKFGKGIRDFLYGQDKKDLTDEQYFAKHGYSKPIGGIGVLGALVMPEWEGLEVLPVAENFGKVGLVKGIPKTAKLKPSIIKNFEGIPKAPTSTIPKVGAVRSSADKHASFVKGLDTWSKRKYGIEWSKMKKEIQPGIEQEFRRIWSK